MINIFTLPLIDVVEISLQIIEIQIKYSTLKVNIRILPSLVSKDGNPKPILHYNVTENNNYIKSFIDDLNNNKNTIYNEKSYRCDEKFKIKVEDDIIKIVTTNSTIILAAGSKNQLIREMNKYYDILNKYPPIDFEIYSESSSDDY